MNRDYFFLAAFLRVAFFLVAFFFVAAFLVAFFFVAFRLEAFFFAAMTGFPPLINRSLRLGRARASSGPGLLRLRPFTSVRSSVPPGPRDRSEPRFELPLPSRTSRAGFGLS